MPFSKQKRISEPLWKNWDILAQKEGLHHSVIDTNGDVYIGEWKDNKKDGKGSMIFDNGQHKYDGDWRNNFRHGYGTLCTLNDSYNFVKEYVGGWKYDKQHGFGTRYFSVNEYYEGEWYANMRSGWGRMFYTDGSVYEGEWFDDQRSGLGILRFSNKDRYDGKWLKDMKNGEGKFYYMDTGHVLIGFWIDDIPKCGTFEDGELLEDSKPTTFQIPVCQLDDPESVILEATNGLKNL